MRDADSEDDLCQFVAAGGGNAREECPEPGDPDWPYMRMSRCPNERRKKRRMADHRVAKMSGRARIA